ncbi:MBL fold metallo-hydrolase [Kitasatospora sp. NPDC086801]|uniref:MBL fold metallo-hydrolase n=1 Tax=Kitasatospora sp. NPDC086801 TaxID=3364066 RepID=UPI00380D6BB0
MTYAGVVEVGGPADVRELPDLVISKVAVGSTNNNAYLLRCRATDEQLLIDAAAEPQTLLSLIGDSGIASVVTTHRHGDHWGALAEVLGATGAHTYAGAYDTEGIPVPTDVPVADGDTLRVGRVELTARHLTGHTPGSIALVYDDPHGHPHPRVSHVPAKPWTGGRVPPAGWPVPPAGPRVPLLRLPRPHCPQGDGEWHRRARSPCPRPAGR